MGRPSWPTPWAAPPPTPLSICSNLNRGWRRAAKIEAQLQSELAACRALPNVKDVRIKGAIGIVELEHLADPAKLRMQLMERNVWIRPFGKIVYLTPALTIGESELTQLTAAIARTLAA